MDNKAYFEIDEISQRGFVFLRIKGDLTSSEMDEFNFNVGLMLASLQSKLVVDITEVSYARSCFLAQFVEFHIRAAERNKSVTFYTSPQMAKRLERIGLNRLLRVLAIHRRTDYARSFEG